MPAAGGASFRLSPPSSGEGPAGVRSCDDVGTLAMHVARQQVEGQRAFIFPADGIEGGNGALRPLHQPRRFRRLAARTWTFHGPVPVLLPGATGGWRRRRRNRSPAGTRGAGAAGTAARFELAEPLDSNSIDTSVRSGFHASPSARTAPCAPRPELRRGFSEPPITFLTATALRFPECPSRRSRRRLPRKVLYGISSPPAISPAQPEPGYGRAAGEHQRLGLLQPASLWPGVGAAVVNVWISKPRGQRPLSTTGVAPYRAARVVSSPRARTDRATCSLLENSVDMVAAESIIRGFYVADDR